MEGNERTDKAAEEAAIGERVRTAKWTSLNHIKQRATEEKKLQVTIWHEQKTKEREACRRGFYIQCLKTQIHPLLGKAKKLYASCFYQFKTGHGAIGAFLEWIGAVESAECLWCGDREQLCAYTRGVDGTSGFEEKFGQDRDSMAEATRKKMPSRAASKCVEIVIHSSGIFWRNLEYAHLILVMMSLKFPCNSISFVTLLRST